jgi:hypothetical protein
VGVLRRHFKVYNKVVQQFQSEAPQKAIGMNTNALFNPQPRMQKTLGEAHHHGVTRLEISYKFDSVQAQQEFLEEGFDVWAVMELDLFQWCLNQLQNVCFKVPLEELLCAF